MLRSKLTADVSFRRVSHLRFVDSGADARNDIFGTLTSYQPLGELHSLLDRVTVFLFEGFESIRNFGSALTRAGFAGDFPAEFSERLLRRPAFTGRRLL